MDFDPVVKPLDITMKKAVKKEVETYENSKGLNKRVKECVCPGKWLFVFYNIVVQFALSPLFGP